jgi:uncharacterized protein (DUF1810 family)
MTDATAENEARDPYDLDRFLRAQEGVYDHALAELRSGRKRSHWMWFVFPQIDGLGLSPTSRYFSIKRRAEAQAYLDHPVLGKRLLECSDSVLAIRGKTAHQIFGSPDDMKLKSCATLFETVAAGHAQFGRLLDAYFGGERDAATHRLLAASNR